ncbi:MAG: hypothetical protein HKP61_18870, partial [Dactylosporangium sp.]|nr:hypothetical protein [Dactylosporangium sp.]NNJ62952.1 hypothetical protein [Dactylosporangium sp.]
ACCVSGWSDHAVRRWDAATGDPVGRPMTGHTDPVAALAVGQLNGQEVIVSGSDDRTVRVWDAATGDPVGQPLTGHTGAVTTVAIGQWRGRPAVVSGSRDGTVRFWNSGPGEPERLGLIQLDSPVTGLVPASPTNVVVATEAAVVSLESLPR